MIFNHHLNCAYQIICYPLEYYEIRNYPKYFSDFVHTFTSNSFLQLLPLHFNLRCWIFVFGLIRSAFFWQKGQQAYFVPLIFRISACPFHGSGGFMYLEKSIPSDSNADLILIYSFLLLFALQLYVPLVPRASFFRCLLGIFRISSMLWCFQCCSTKRT